MGYVFTYNCVIYDFLVNGAISVLFDNKEIAISETQVP